MNLLKFGLNKLLSFTYYLFDFSWQTKKTLSETDDKFLAILPVNYLS